MVIAKDLRMEGGGIVQVACTDCVHQSEKHKWKERKRAIKWTPTDIHPALPHVLLGLLGGPSHYRGSGGLE